MLGTDDTNPATSGEKDESTAKMAAALKQRRGKLMAALGDVPALILAGHAPARNYAANQYEFRASSHYLYFAGVPLAGAALLLHDGHATLYVPPHGPDDALWHGETMTHEELKAKTGVDEVYPLPRLADHLERIPDPGRLPTVPVEERGSADEQLIDAIIALRLCHDAEALGQMRRAAAVTTRAHAAGRRTARPGTRVSQVRAAMEHEILAANFTTAYPSIVTVRGEVLHNLDRVGTCRVGDLLLADVGAESDTGWASDVTRTWPVSGQFSASQRALYELVLAAQLQAIASVKPGVRYREVHLHAAYVICAGLRDEGLLAGDLDSLVERGAHALFFPHGIGHLLGLDVHDMEDLGDRAQYAPGRTRSPQFGLSYLRLDRDLMPGMVVTIEPGIYLVPAILRNQALTEPLRDVLRLERLERFGDVRGIRIEDDVLVTESGAEVLTAQIPKAVSDIELQ
jgi:Xaa-Pro aminopeptidase